MKNLLLILFSILLSNLCFGQTIDMQVISSSGYYGSQNQLEYTVGEVIIAGNSKLTQGFHQGNLIITAIDDVILDIEITAYPNPAMHGVNINTNDIDNAQIRLFDFRGKQLATITIDRFPYYVDMNKYASGVYFIQLYNKKQILKTFKVEKIK